MNYLKHYIKLIRKAQSETQSGYCEKHHVFPVSIFGKNKFIVKMTARQHYIAHALLQRIYIKRYGEDDMKSKKMIRAFFMMNTANGIGQHRYFNSRLFEKSKLTYIKSVTGKNSPLYGKKRVFSEKHLENMRKSRKYGPDHPLYGIPRTEEIKKKISKPKCASHSKSMSEVRKGMKFTEEHKKNLSESHKGNIPWNKGKCWSYEQKKNMSAAQRNKDYSFMNDEYKNKISESMKLVWAERRKKKQMETLS